MIKHTLGADYAEEALTARIAGRPRPSRQPQQRTGKPSLLIDIQNNLKAKQNAGYKHWATIENLKCLDAVPLPATQRLRAEMDELTARRTALQSELRKIQREEKEYDILRKNIRRLQREECLKQPNTTKQDIELS